MHDLRAIARQAMIDRDLLPEFGRDVERELRTIEKAEGVAGNAADLRDLLWASIDNDDSRDLDQLSVAESLAGGRTRVLVAIADVGAVVSTGSAIDRHARHNTTSVYTAAQIFPMLPEKLSTDLTSLNPGEERLAVVMEMIVDDAGHVRDGNVQRALVHNRAQLAYDSVGAWLEGRGAMPEAMARIEGLDEVIRLQSDAAQRLRRRRYELGALDLETIEARAVMSDGKVIDVRATERNRARDLIEDFMIAANGVAARFLAGRRFPSIRRVVRAPERWGRIVELAAGLGETLPPEPDSLALEEFLLARKREDPARFPDLSLTIIKLMGRGEYVFEPAGSSSPGHFGLAVRDYTHSTAPNRRYPDLITQRLLEAAIAHEAIPYSLEDLEALAAHCTAKENDADKVERLVMKAAAAILLESRIGERFDAFVTGASPKGTWVRILRPPIEGKLVKGSGRLDVGDRIRVKLVGTDVERGYIDFERVRK
ncbi:MAG TPA: RNB domain-containing ribonuclease [Thermoanaerobaculia bacterium]|nr:RNB domain-containing ribonuclease [Thermoanaerobaculia bacterium]